MAGSRPDLVVVEALCRTGLRTDMIAQLRQQYPELLIFVLSVGDDATYAERVLRAGANGYLSKDHSSAEILAGIRQVLNGEISVAKTVANALLHRMAGTATAAKSSAVPVDQLSDRELEIFRLIGHGRGTGQIAKQLNVSVSTVETYRLRLKQKLGLKTAAELARCAVCWVEGSQDHYHI